MVKYQQIAKELENRIIAGVYPQGTALPEQVRLAQEFKTSRITIQKALDILRHSGYIYSRQGAGTFVRQNVLSTVSKTVRADEYWGSTRSFEGMYTVSSQILQFEVRFPNKEEQEHLMINETQPVYDIIRLRLLDDKPHVIEYTVMPIQVIPDITEDILHHSIYNHIEGTLGLKIGGINRIIRAIKPNKLAQSYLHCAKNDPVLDVEQVVYLEDGTPFEISHCHYHYKVGSVYVSS